MPASRKECTLQRVTGDRRDSVEGIGWEHLHVAIDDASRLAYTELLPDDRKDSATGFPSRALLGSPDTVSPASAS